MDCPDSHLLPERDVVHAVSEEEYGINRLLGDDFIDWLISVLPSYIVTDLAWSHAFAPCIRPIEGAESEQERFLIYEGCPTRSVDCSRCHSIARAPDDCEAC